MALHAAGRARLDLLRDEIQFDVDGRGTYTCPIHAVAGLTSGRDAAEIPLCQPRQPPVWLRRTRPGRALTFSVDGRAYIVPIRALVRVIHREQTEVEISTPIDDARDLDDAASRQQTLGAWA